MRTWPLVVSLLLLCASVPVQAGAPHPTSGLPLEVEGFPGSGLALIPESALQLTPVAKQDRFQVVFRVTNQGSEALKSFDVGYELREHDGFVAETGGFTVYEPLAPRATRRIRHEIIGLRLEEGQRLVLLPWGAQEKAAHTDPAPRSSRLAGVSFSK
jgi:hypothetical protein